MRIQNSLLAAVGLALGGCSVETPTSAVEYPEPDTEAARLYLQKCGLCHVAPEPSLHTSKVWFGVVQRMQMRMRSRGVQPLEKVELDAVLGYLQRHAGSHEPIPEQK